jgi:hypothetical protein
MDELRQAVQALAAAAQNLERQLSDMGDVPSRDQLEACIHRLDDLNVVGRELFAELRDAWVVVGHCQRCRRE